MKIIDAFLFCHELDLLEVRLRYLYDYVDRFVILESDYTHMNRPKPLYFYDNRSRYDFAKDKIVYVRKAGPIYKTKDHDDLYVENQFRHSLYNSTLSISNNPDDIIMLGDVDEFYSREGLEGLKKGFKSPTIFNQDLYYYNVKSPQNKKMTCTMAIRTDDKFLAPQEMRKNRSRMNPLDDGWHFSYFMNNDEMRIKLTSFSHANDYGNGAYVTDAYINEHKKNGTNFLNKSKGKTPPNPIPDYLMDELKKFPVFMGEA
jgi:beta-1,4-mannosyl-glycoprotein beta-1,4-N-acetylglucosaminyltransferase